MMMTIGGLAFSVGMVVDATIVVVENIRRHLATGPPGASKRQLTAKAFAEAVEQGESLDTAATEMLQAARAGRDAAIPLRSKIGRASWVGERTENQPDPGTVLLVQVLEAILGVAHSSPGSSQ